MAHEDWTMPKEMKYNQAAGGEEAASVEVPSAPLPAADAGEAGSEGPQGPKVATRLDLQANGLLQCLAAVKLLTETLDEGPLRTKVLELVHKAKLSAAQGAYQAPTRPRPPAPRVSRRRRSYRRRNRY